MPRRKKVASDDIKSFEDNDESLIVHLPIKTNKIKIQESTKNISNMEIENLRKENTELKKKISQLMVDNFKKVSVIKNKSTNDKISKCWWCDGQCSSKILLPEKRIKNTFHGFGSFCSLNCAMAYNFDKKDEKVWERCSLLHQLKDNLKMTEGEISVAPPKEVLIDYGGELSREEYESLLLTVNNSFIKLLPPMVSATIMIEQRNKNTPELSQLSLMGLKLKRNKKPTNNKFSLDSLLS